MEVQYEMLAQQDGVSLRSYTRGFKSSWKMEQLFGVKKKLETQVYLFHNPYFPRTSKAPSDSVPLLYVL